MTREPQEDPQDQPQGRCGQCVFWLPYIRDAQWEGSGDCTNENLRGRIVGFDHTFGCVLFKSGRIEDAKWMTRKAKS